MFPLDTIEPSAPAPNAEIPLSNSYMHLQPKMGSHIQNYKIYRTSTVPPPVLHRMTQRGAAIIGVEEVTLRYSIRWIESKLNRWKANPMNHDLSAITI
jgi:hypothetical protein